MQTYVSCSPATRNWNVPVLLAIIFLFVQSDAFAQGSMVNGGNYTGTIATTTQTDTWTFTATAGNAISVSMSEVGANTTFHPYIQVKGPSAQSLGAAQGDLSGEVDFVAPATGTYTVLAARYDATTQGGAYVLTFAQAPGAVLVPAGDEGGPMTNGGNHTGTILRGDLDQWTFDATAGNAISVSISEVGSNTTFHPYIRIHGPTGQDLGAAQGDLSAELSFTASVTGSYTVLVARYDATDVAGQYLLTLAQAPGSFVVPSGDEGGAMTNGGNHTGSILRGDLDQWSFDATAGNAITVSVSESGTNTTFHPYIRIHGPNGQDLGAAQGDLSAELSFTASVTGSYTVIVARYDATDGAGLYTLTLAKAPGAVTVPLGDEGGAMTNGGNHTGTILRGDLDQWTFDATAGNAITVTASEVGANTTFHPYIRIHGPNGQDLGAAQGDLSAELSFAVTVTGTYTVIVARYDATDGAGQYVLTLAKAPGTFAVPTGDEGGPMTNGENYSGTILRGDLDQWSFTATAGNAITVSVSEVGANTTFHPWIRIHGPNGQDLGSAQGDLSTEISFTASVTGSYTVIVARYDATDGAGQYSITLAQAPGGFVVPSGDDGGVLSVGVNATGTILRGDLDQWSFNAVQGSAVVITINEVEGNTSFHPWIRVHGPSGQDLGSAQADVTTEIRFNAPATGAYTVLVARYDATDGAGRYQITSSHAGTVIPPSCTYSLSTPGVSVPSTQSNTSVNVTVTGANCSWAATSPDNWALITSGATGTVSGTVAIQVLANPGTSSRSTTLTIAGSTFTISQAGFGLTSGLRFVPLEPCRILETRPEYNFQGRTGPFGPPFLNKDETRTLIPSQSTVCQIPATAKAFMLNVTLVPRGAVDYVTVWPAGDARPTFWTVRSPDGQIVANSAIVKAGANGAISVFASDNTDAIIDISGYFTDDAAVTGYTYYPLTPCRVVDTRVLYRSTVGPFGPPTMTGGERRSFQVPSTPYCQIPSGAKAFSVTLTVVPPGPLAFLTAWPTGGAQPNVSSINSPAGRILANSVVLPASAIGSVDLFVFNTSDVLVDITGYFAPDDNATGLFYFPVTQCRASDAQFIDEEAKTTVVPTVAGCTGIPTTAKGYAANVTAIPSGSPMPFLTVYGTGQARPNASTLNAFEGQTVTNSTIVPSGTNGALDIFAYRHTRVVLEISGYFGR